jgi:hypothetical protein
MDPKNNLSTKIKILANRLRCPVCNADSDEAVFIIEEESSFKKIRV